LVSVDIARCQRVSTTTCGKNFFVQNLIKTKFKKCFNIKHLKSVPEVAIEESCNDFDHILIDAIDLWKNSIKWRNFYSHLKKYLIGQPCIEDEHDTMVL